MKREKKNLLLTAVSVTCGFMIVFPIIWLILSSFKPAGELFSFPLSLFPREFTFEHYINVIEGGFLTYVYNSFFLAVVGTFITLAISAMCGYALAIYRYQVKYTNMIFGVFLLGTLIPGETLTISQFNVISGLGLYNNIWGVILPVVTTTTGIFLYRQFYLSVPMSYVEAARIDGASEYFTFFKVMLPLSKTTTLTLMLFSFMWRWNDYILPLMVLSSQENFTIQVAIRNFIGPNGVDWNSILAASVLSFIPVAILFMFMQKYIIGINTSSGDKG